MRCVLACLLPFACATAVAQAPAPLVKATLVVADTKQFAPTTWRLCIEVPRGSGSLGMYVPVGRFERMHEGGGWRPVVGRTQRGEMPARPFFPAADVARTFGGCPCGGAGRRVHAPPPGRWLLAAGESWAFAGETVDWPVLVVPGTYRIRGTLSFESGQQELLSSEFQIATSVAAAALREELVDGSRLWQAYERTLIEVGFFATQDMAQSIAPPIHLFLPRAVVYDVDGWEIMSRTTGMPIVVRDRKHLLRLHTGSFDARSIRDNEQRTQALQQHIADCRLAGTLPGVTGALARLMALIGAKAYGFDEQFESLLAAAREDRLLLEVGACFPEMMFAVGLMAPEQDPNAKGLGGPRGPPTAYRLRRVGW